MSMSDNSGRRVMKQSLSSVYHPAAGGSSKDSQTMSLAQTGMVVAIPPVWVGSHSFAATRSRDDHDRANCRRAGAGWADAGLGAGRQPTAESAASSARPKPGAPPLRGIPNRSEKHLPQRRGSRSPGHPRSLGGGVGILTTTAWAADVLLPGGGRLTARTRRTSSTMPSLRNRGDRARTSPLPLVDKLAAASCFHAAAVGGVIRGRPDLLARLGPDRKRPGKAKL
jgi:hypothetical protein